MLKDLVINMTENYHDLGHNGSSVDAMMDGASGMGHRIKEGHDLQGLIEAYDLEGVNGIGLWFNHMLKDFTSPAGVPLPFAEAIQNVTDMPMDKAIDWLTINASDVLALGTQEAALKFFKNNKKASKGIYILGTGLGIIDDNPLIVILNTYRLLKSDKLSFLKNEATMNFLKRTSQLTGRICVGTAAVTVGAGMVGFNIPAEIEELGEVFDLVDGATIAADLVDGVATLGLGIAASYGVKKVSNYINGDLQEDINSLKENLSLYKSLQNQAKIGTSLNTMQPLIEHMEEQKLLPRRN